MPLEVLRLVWEMPLACCRILSVDVLELKATVSAKTLTKVPAEAAAHLSKAPAKSFLNPKSFAAVEEEEEN